MVVVIIVIIIIISIIIIIIIIIIILVLSLVQPYRLTKLNQPTSINTRHVVRREFSDMRTFWS